MHEDELSQETALVKVEPLPLAWDKSGQRFRVPDTAREWRVHRKADGRGRPSPIFTASGPLHIDIDASFETLAEAVKHKPGWYVLYGINEHGVVLADCPPAHVQVVTEVFRPQEPSGNESPTVSRLCTVIEQFMLCSAQRDEAICGALGSLTSAVSDIQRSTAELIRASANGMDVVSGAGLPKMPPPPPAPQLPPPPPSKTLMDFLTSPAGNTIAEAVSSVATSLAKNLEPNP